MDVLSERTKRLVTAKIYPRGGVVMGRQVHGVERKWGDKYAAPRGETVMGTHVCGAGWVRVSKLCARGGSGVSVVSPCHFLVDNPVA